MRKRFKNILILIVVLIILLLVLGVFYIIYKNVKDEAVIKTSGVLSINYENGYKLKISKNKEVKFSVINSSDEKAYYYIEFLNPKNIKGDIKYTLTNGENVTISDTLNSYSTIISSYIEIEGNETHNYTLTINAKENIAYSFELGISIENDETTNFADTILANNDVKDEPLTVPGKEIATEDEGLIKTNDDYGSAYYFRGNVQNNNVVIDDLNYKIVKINGDGSVKLVLDGVTDTIKKYYDDVSNYSYKNSNINTYLINDWFTKNIKDSKFYIANQKYCNDNTKNGDDLLALTRIKVDNIPSFVCLGDRYLSKVGLLTVDEVIYAGATMDKENDSFYLYNQDISTGYFLMTGASLDDDDYHPFTVSATGKVLDTDSGSHLRSVRPVITIIKTATVTGSGTVDDPYMLTQ